MRFRQLVAKNVRRLRRRHGWTQRQLAERLQCHKQTVWAIEAGRQGISDRLMDDLARTFEVDYAELVRREDESDSDEHRGTASGEGEAVALRKDRPGWSWPMIPEDVHSLIRRVAYEAVRELMREYQVRPPEASSHIPPDRAE